MAKQDEGPRSGVHFLTEVADGACAASLSAELQRLGVILVDESTARDATVKGSITLVLKFSAESSGHVNVAYDIKTKEPAKVTRRGVVWLTPSGNFTHENPRQLKLGGLREVVKEIAGVRDLGAAADGEG